MESNIQIVPYHPELALETVKMWRQSFQRAMLLEEHNRLEELEPQLAYFASIAMDDITLAMDTSSNTIVGMMVLQGCEVSQLYVHVGYQGEGIGTQLIGLAKTCSEGYLELFTFQKNKRAQAFYIKHGWIEVAQGFASADDNPWANSTAELADIKFVWRGAP